MTQPLFDPLDAAVLTRQMVPWASAALATEAARQREELMQRTTDTEVWRWTGMPAAHELEERAREVRRDYFREAARAVVERVRAIVHKALPVHPAAVRGEHA